jgi:hypothetical protein
MHGALAALIVRESLMEGHSLQNLAFAKIGLGAEF